MHYVHSWPLEARKGKEEGRGQVGTLTTRSHSEVLCALRVTFLSDGLQGLQEEFFLKKKKKGTVSLTDNEVCLGLVST